MAALGHADASFRQDAEFLRKAFPKHPRPALPVRPTGEFDPELEAEAWRHEMGRCLAGSVAEAQVPNEERDRVVAELQNYLDKDPDFVEQHALCPEKLRTYAEASAEYREAKRRRLQEDHDEDGSIAEDSEFGVESDDCD